MLRGSQRVPKKKLDLFEDPKLEGYMRFQAEDDGGAGEGWKVRIYIDVWLDGGNPAPVDG